MNREHLKLCPVCGCEFWGGDRRVTCSRVCNPPTPPPPQFRPPRVTARDRDRWMRLFGQQAADARLNSVRDAGRVRVGAGMVRYE